MGRKDPRVDAYIRKAPAYARPILTHLRRVVHQGCPEVEETLKWSMPSFTHHGILCGMAAFKNHCTFGFWKSSLLETEGLRTSDEKAMGQFGRIGSLADLPSEKALVELVREAAKLNEQGVKRPVKPRSKAPRTLEVPAYFMTALRKNRKALAHFEAGSYSHRKEYVEWVGEAKTEATRQRRLATAIEWLAEGKSRNWKYERKARPAARAG